MKNKLLIIMCMFLLGCASSTNIPSETTPVVEENEMHIEQDLKLSIDGQEVPVIFEDNESVLALKEPVS